MKNKTYYLDNPDEMATLLASSPQPAQDAVVISLLKNGLLQAYIAKAIADATAGLQTQIDDLQGSPQ